jgi:hypothetical protein
MFGMEHKILLAANICDSIRVAHTTGISYRLIILLSHFWRSKGEILLSQKGTFTSSQFSKINLNWLAAYHTICREYSTRGRHRIKASRQH